MKLKKSFLITLMVLPGIFLFAQPSGRENFDANWKFHLGDVPNAERTDFPDQKWRSLDLPHDWSIEGNFRPDNPSGHQGGLLPGGIGWYRKKFIVNDPSEMKYFILIDGAYKNSTVYVNGHPLGTRPYGYATFQYDMTQYIQKGENVLAVKVDNSKQPDSRWYTGAGIYRHVWLITSSPVYVGQWGTFVTTPKVSEMEATVNVTTTIFNDSQEKADLKISSSIVDPSGKEVAVQLQSGKASLNSKTTLISTIKVNHPQLWDIQHPHLYNLITKVFQGKILKDTYTTTFGIRSIAFRADSGFY
ncbi:MAG: sugar-binding domain-containing protein, partial [Mariniphaga sp.]